jgi:hypothetical protein
MEQAFVILLRWAADGQEETVGSLPKAAIEALSVYACALESKCGFAGD